MVQEATAELDLATAAACTASFGSTEGSLFVLACKTIMLTLFPSEPEP